MKLTVLIYCYLIFISANSFAQQTSAAAEANSGGNSLISDCESNPSLKSQFNCKCLSDKIAETYNEATVSSNPRLRAALLKKIGNSSKGLSCRSDFKIPTELQLNNESSEVFEHCKSNPKMRVNFNCQCLSKRFIEKRRELGSTPKWDAIFLRLRNECRNVEATTELEYTMCMQRFGKKNAKNMKPKEFCECYANKWAELFENATVDLNHSYKSSLKSQARGFCINMDRKKSVAPKAAIQLIKGKNGNRGAYNEGQINLIFLSEKASKKLI